MKKVKHEIVWKEIIYNTELITRVYKEFIVSNHYIHLLLVESTWSTQQSAWQNAEIYETLEEPLKSKAY
jgi:hypothetical protein